MLMTILECMERHLGSIESWPSDILVLLFCCPPNESRLREIASFCYGNDVHLSIASDFYHFYNTASTPFDHEAMERYSYFQFYLYKHHQGTYFNMSTRKFMFINGKCLDQTEEVNPNLPHRTLESRPQVEMLIRSKLHHSNRDRSA